MTGSRRNGSEDASSRLRPIVSRVDRAMSSVLARTEAGQSAPPEDLLESWAELVEALALGPEPELRDCPVCGRRGMRAATRCGYCWAKLTPLPESVITTAAPA